MIQARNLYLTYDNNKYIIKQGNFSIKEGEFVFIGGNSGSGKSTLLKSFYGELPIRHGELNIAKQSVVGIKGNKLRVLRKDIGIYLILCEKTYLFLIVLVTYLQFLQMLIELQYCFFYRILL